MEKAVVLHNAGQSTYVLIMQLTTFIAIGPKELMSMVGPFLKRRSVLKIVPPRTLKRCVHGVLMV